VDRILVAVDTSGSIDSDDLSQFLRELNRLQEVTPMDVMEFDAEATSLPRKYDKKRNKFDFKGRGGTSFQPCVDMAQKRKYKGLIILTDGQAPAPTKPPMTRVLWALTKPGYEAPVKWGQSVCIKKKASMATKEK
jgi:predicted metal-dependent peptidase